MKPKKAFTLIELAVVIVLLGMLGVIALGKLQNLSGDAQNAANEGVAAELASASAINYAARLLNPAALDSVAVTSATQTCSALGGLFQSLAIPTGYTVSGSGDCSTAGATISCSVVSSGTSAGVAATATVICTP